jgi:putative hydrolase of the HAD superfamily
LKAVLFDIGGVVVAAGLERYLQRAELLFGASEAMKRELVARVRDLEMGRLTTWAFWDGIGQSLLASGEGRRPRARHTVNLWRSLMLDSLVPNRPLLWLCQAMARNGVVVGAVSNTIQDHADILHERGIYAPFDPCVLSCRVGMRKPDPEIFKLAARLARVSPYGCIIVDDNADNLPTAASLGMVTHHYRDVIRLGRFLKSQRLVTAPQFQRFMEVVSAEGLL